MTSWAREVYPTRPGPSPVLGALLLAGLVGPRDRVLDVGCGTGLDAVALAGWGVRSVTGIDVSPRAVAVARRRAKRQRARARFEVCDVAEVPGRFPRGAFDVAVDTMCVNNLRGGQDAGYARALAWALRPGGRLVVQGRLWRRDFQRAAALQGLEALEACFDLAGPVHVAIPDSVEPAALVALYLGWRNRRAPPAPGA